MADFGDKSRKDIKQLGRFFELVPEMLCIASSKDGYFKELNPAWEQTLGFTIEELLSKPLFEFIHPDDRVSTMLEVEKQLKGHPTIHFNNRYICKDGSYRWFSWTSTQAEGNLLYASARDITKYKKAEEELKKSELRLKESQRIAKIGTWEYDQINHKLWWSDETYRIFGLSPEKGPPSPELFLDTIHPEDVGTLKNEILTGKAYRTDYRVVLPDGEMRYVHEEVKILESKNGEPSLIRGTAQDITQLKMAMNMIEKTENQYRTLLQNIPQKIFYKDINSVYMLCNESYAKDLNINPSEIVGKTDYDFYPQELAEKYIIDDKKIMDSGKMVELEEKYVFNNNEMLVNTLKSPIFDENGKVAGIFGMFWDITERKKLEEELQKIHKIESTGVLAGGIAHDFNNMLAGIINNIYLSKIYVGSESKAYDKLISVEKAVQRATNLTQQLLTFSKGGAPITKTASIVEILKESAEFVLSGSNTTCEYNILNNVWLVEVDQGQISQAIHNLILNASQSMPTGGTIGISIDNIHITSDTGLPIREGKYLKILIQDEGTGVPEEHLKNIYDPYFTTKEMGRGLGLSITYSIIKNHKGHISVQSKMGVGTTFTIYLPASDILADEKESAENTFIMGQGKILLMDDEEVIRESMGVFLSMSGYEIEYAEDGAEAVALYQKAMETSKPIDAVILDLTVRGGMGGIEAMKKLLDIDPKVKAIVSSGYSNDPVMSNFREYGFSNVLTKPLRSPEELSKILHKVLQK